MLSDKAQEAKAEYHRQNRKKRLENRTLEQIEKEREYQKEWRRNNPDKIKDYNDTYWERRALKNLGSNGNDGELDTKFFDAADSYDMKKAINQGEIDPKQAAIALRNKGVSLRGSAELLGISHMQVKRLLATPND